MKKYVLSLIAFMALVFVSCEGPMGPEGPMGQGMGWDVDYLTVNSNEWNLEWDGDTPYFICVKNYPKLVPDIYEGGHVFAYYFINYNTTDERQTLLPRYLEFTQAVEGGYHDWTESITYDYTAGTIAFYYQISDFYVEQKPPTSHFRIVMNW